MSGWSLAYDGFEPAAEGLREALTTLGNGYFATRGAAAWASADGVHYPGTYVAGCYDRLESEIVGRVVEDESLVNAPNWLPLTFRCDGGDWLDLRRVEILDYRQELDLRRGILTRLLHFRDERGRATRMAERRLVHMAMPHLAALETTVVPENWSGTLEVRSALDGRVANTGVERYHALASRHLAAVESRAPGDGTLQLVVETSQSRIRIAQAARTQVLRDGTHVADSGRAIEEEGYVAEERVLDVEEGVATTVEKVVALVTSRDRAISECSLEAEKQLERAGPFDELLERHVLAWDHLWRRCGLTVEADEHVALALRVHVFHLLQSVSPNTVDLDVGVPARGLHGEAYRGHVFWDELFVLPFLNLRLPRLSRTLLLYRYRRLFEARAAARAAGLQGAMYPWQSGSDGREETPQVHLNPRSGRWLPDNSGLQRHVAAAVAYNVWQYYQASGDNEFLASYGAEMILEVARFFASLASYDRSLDRYEIRGVVGPDEYHDAYPGAKEPGLANNAYTNVMAVWVLCHALEVLELLPEDQREELKEELALRPEELARFDEVSRKMRVPFHDDGIVSQFDGYERLDELDWERYRPRDGESLRLDRILEAEGDTPNRYKASKQADVLMLFYLLSADELRALFDRLGYGFEYETIPRNIAYYVQRTSHGSTLSGVVHSWVLARADRRLSWEFFTRALESDIADVAGGTTSEGIHLGAMAGTLDLLQRCYTGLEIRDDVLWLNPLLPEELERLSFAVRYRGHRVTIEVTEESLKVSLRAGVGTGITLGVSGETVALEPGESVEFPLT